MLDSVDIGEKEFFGLSPHDYLEQVALGEAISYAQNMLVSEGLLQQGSPEFIEETAFLVWDLEKVRADAIYNSLSDVDKVEYMRLINNGSTVDEALSFANSRVKDMLAIIKHAWDNFRHQWERIQ